MQREDIRATQRETKLGMVAPTYNFTKGEVEAGYVKFEVSLGYTVSSRSTSTTVFNLNNEIKLKYRGWGKRNPDQRSYIPSSLWPAQPWSPSLPSWPVSPAALL